MKTHFIAIGYDHKVLLSGTKEPDGISISYLSPKLKNSQFSSIDEVLMHNDVARIETPQPINESISAATYFIGNARLTRAESVIFDALKQKNGEYVPLDVLSAIVETFGGAAKNSMRTIISRLRKKIAPTGATIESGWKKGYKLEM